jgi:hypothetical protein
MRTPALCAPVMAASVRRLTPTAYAMNQHEAWNDVNLLPSPSSDE